MPSTHSPTQKIHCCHKNKRVEILIGNNATNRQDQKKTELKKFFFNYIKTPGVIVFFDPIVPEKPFGQSAGNAMKHLFYTSLWTVYNTFLELYVDFAVRLAIFAVKSVYAYERVSGIWAEKQNRLESFL